MAIGERKNAATGRERALGECVGKVLWSGYVDIKENSVTGFEPVRRNQQTSVIFAVLVRNRHVWCVNRDHEAFWQI